MEHDHHHHHRAKKPHDAAPGSEAGKVKDPVCGMWVDPARALHAAHAGSTYHFCSAGCRTKFLADPSRYLKPGGSEERPASTGGKPTPDGVIYTCPMHPQIRQIGPGSCPFAPWRSSR